jgi:hypothetical protein
VDVIGIIVTFMLNFFLDAEISLFAAFIVLSIVLAIAFFSFAYRPTKEGKQLLTQLEEQFAVYAKYDAATWALTPPATRLAAVAVLGTGILAGSPAAALADVLEGKSSNGDVEFTVEG